MYRHLIIAGAIVLNVAPARSQATNNVGNEAVKDRSPHMTASASNGANSFTHDQAQDRLAKAGYVVSSLTKDKHGVWRGSATKSGKTVNVGLDFKGNITER